MALVLGHHVTTEQVYRIATRNTRLLLDPQEVLDRGVLIPAANAGSLIEGPDLRFDGVSDLLGGGSKDLPVQVSDLLAHDPICHWIDVGANDVTPRAVRLQQGSTAAHKGVADGERAQVVPAEETVSQGLLAAAP